MNLWSLVRTDSLEVGPTSFFNTHAESNQGIARWLMVLIFLPIAFLTPCPSSAQNNHLFAVNPIIRDVRAQLKLNIQDVRLVAPLIEQENRDVLLIYARFDSDEPEYSPALWKEVVNRRLDFESRSGSNLTNRQKAALRIARTALERRVLGILVDDYIYFLVDILELTDLQTEGIDYLLKIDCRKKHRSIINHYMSPAFLEAEIKLIEKETDSKMSDILSPAQLRIYHSLYLPDLNLVG